MATLGEVLLTPTRIYARSILGVRADLLAHGWDLLGLAHITGGGLPRNVPRALPEGLAGRVDPARWIMPSVIRLVGALAGMDAAELRMTFNGGLGMVAIVTADAVPATIAAFAERGHEAMLVGEVVAAEATSGDRYVEGRLEGPLGAVAR
jgi:phosphoribosylformylglycinamidine cyclo-ligase